MTEEGDILEIIKNHCNLVVTVIDSEIYLHHQTARIFLVSEVPDVIGLETHGGYNPMVMRSSSKHTDWKYSIRQGESIRILAERCLWYLKLTRSGIEGNQKLFQYCAYWWVSHFKGSDIADQRLFDLAVDMCDKNLEYLNYWFRYYRSNTSILDSRISDSPVTFLSVLGLHTVVENLLAEVSKKDKDKLMLSEALYWASLSRHVELCRLLIKHGADPNMKHSTYLGTGTCLHEAAWLSDINLLEILLENGADINAKDSSLRTALFIAVLSSRTHCVTFLLKHGINSKHREMNGYTALGYMYSTGNHDGQVCLAITKQSIEHEPNFYDLLYQGEKQERATCHACAHHLLRYAIDAKGAKGAQSRRSLGSKSLLHFAIAFNTLDLVEEFLQAGSKSSARSKTLSELLIYASKLPPGKCNPDTIDLLVAHGASINDKSSEGITWMHLAMLSRDQSRFADPTPLQQLLAKPPDIDAQDMDGKTPLMYGVRSSISDQITATRVKMLLEYGADYALTDMNGRTAHLYAFRRGKSQTVKVLEDWTLSELLR